MGGLLLNCPLCCDKTFSSKQSLIEHLANILENVYCPVCNNKWTSVVHLIEHLTLDNCRPDNIPFPQTVIFEENTQNNIENRTDIQNSDIKVYEDDNITQSNCDSNFPPLQTYEANMDSSVVSNMYVELLNKQPCLRTQELKLVKENGESRYMIMTQEDVELNGETIVTKQNNDGTISLTAVEDMKLEPDGVLATEVDLDEGQEIYSCNTCKVSFSSVIEHIQNYHNDQDVVVEEPIEDETDAAMGYEALEEEPPGAGDKQPPRRVITDTGDIVEEPLVLKPIEDLVQPRSDDILAQNKEIVRDKAGRVYTRRYVQVENLCDSIVRDIKKDEPEDRQRSKQSDQRGPSSEAKCHKVVVKEVQGEDGTVKIYDCLTCNITAGNLNDFKDLPCKIRKYTCPHCPMAYDNSKSLCAHMKVHKTKTVDNLYGCAICCTIFPSNKSLKLHKRMHDPIKSRPIDPPVQNTDGSSASAGRYLCAECDKMIPVDYRAVHAASHRAGDHANCTVCNKKFTSLEYLEMHMNVHNMDKVTVNKQDKSLPYQCLYCHRRFARPHEKVKHERIHTGEKPHSCEICGKSFRVSYCLTLHMRTHTGARPYACKHCGKRFKAHSVYNHHLLTHSEVRAYKCPYCPKAFKTSVQLAGHKNSHTKPFSCQHCNRPFASLYAVRVHTETHARQNNLKFSCALCGASYARAFALKDHVKQVHKQDVDAIEHLPAQDDDWIVKEKIETEDIQSLNNDLQEEITELGTSELIVP